MSTLKGKTLFITGASRGIGLAIALRAARDGANIAIAAKTTEPHPRLPGTLYTAAEEIEKAGGRALPCVVDVRYEDQVQAAVAKTVETFGGIDILVNNASAIHLSGTVETPMKKWDLMHGINARGTFLCSQACIPHLRKAKNPHILNNAPPPSIEAALVRAPRGLLAGQVRDELLRPGHGRGVPGRGHRGQHALAEDGDRHRRGAEPARRRRRRCSGSRTPEIMADAAHAILTKPSREFTGRFCVDEDVLRAEGVTDFSRYATAPGAELIPDFFLYRVRAWTSASPPASQTSSPPSAPS